MTIALSLFLYCKTTANHLWLSITSVRFYQDVYNLYKGYGARYIFTISFISSLFFCIFIFNYILVIKDFFQENKQSKDSENLSYILKQLPDINYDGQNISLNDNSPLYLYDIYDRKIGVIDIASKISFSEKSKLLISLTSKDVIISLIQTTNKKITTFPISYQSIFGPKAQLLTYDAIKRTFAEIFDSVPRIFIYLIMPILIFIRFLSILFEKGFIILIIYLVTNFIINLKTSMKTCIRLALFSSGVVILIQPIVVLLLPFLSESLWIVQTWSNILIFLAVIKIRNTSL